MRAPSEHSRSSLRRPSRAPWIVLAVALVAGAVAIGWKLLRAPGPPPPVFPAPAPTEAAAPAPAPTPAAPPTAAEARALVEALSPDPLFRRATAEDPFGRAAHVLAALANGESPRKALAGLAPAASFSVVTRGRQTFVAPASYARYDAFANAVGSVDADRAAAAYRALRGPLEAALRAAGYPDARLDDVAGRALRRVAGTPVPEGEVRVVGVRGFYAFADPKLEDLSEVEKHLLRMGPRNQRLVQEKARALLQALGLPAAGP